MSVTPRVAEAAKAPHASPGMAAGFLTRKDHTRSTGAKFMGQGRPAPATSVGAETVGVLPSSDQTPSTSAAGLTSEPAVGLNAAEEKERVSPGSVEEAPVAGLSSTPLPMGPQLPLLPCGIHATGVHLAAARCMPKLAGVHLGPARRMPLLCMGCGVDRAMTCTERGGTRRRCDATPTVWPWTPAPWPSPTEPWPSSNSPGAPCAALALKSSQSLPTLGRSLTLPAGHSARASGLLLADAWGPGFCCWVRYEEAERDCSQALERDDEYVKALSRRATARLRLKRPLEALQGTCL